jgi:hypothetical protein
MPADELAGHHLSDSPPTDVNSGVRIRPNQFTFLDISKYEDGFLPVPVQLLNKSVDLRGNKPKNRMA